MLLNVILIFCAGYTFALGGLNLAIGLSYKKDRTYLFFGLISLLASIFLMLQISTVSDYIHADILDILTIITAVAFYSLFIWFIGEYSGFKKLLLQWIITAMTGSVTLIYFAAMASVIPWQLFEILAHLTILCISTYGFYAGIKGLKNASSSWRFIYLSSMFGLFALTIIVGVGLSFGVSLILDPEGYISPLDFFPVFFSILIGSKMSHDVVLSYQLESKIKQKEREWSRLMETINLIMVELDLNGTVRWVNSFFWQHTGFQKKDIVRKNWFDTFLIEGERQEARASFDKYIAGDQVPLYQNHIKTANGDLKNIQWSVISLQDPSGNTTGTLNIGTDVTDRESTLKEIRHLKDQLEKENLLLKEEVKWQEYSSEIIGKSDTLMYVLKRTHQVSSTDSSVLLEGETGVGKELFANMIHHNSLRKHKPFIKVNCASLPKELIESELFGHEKGAFTGAIKTRQGRFELADKGTIFLDEIGELPLDLQPKLLRVLQTGEFERIGGEKTRKVDVRVIAATNRDLQHESNIGKFRQDLFFRLNVYPITIPPLRHRKEDLPILISHFTEKIGRKIGILKKQISKADISKLKQYDWPGNIRELENVLERAMISSEGDTIKLDDDQLIPSLSQQINNSSSSISITTLSDSQKKHITNALEECDWKINGEEGAARKLGMPPSTLRSKMKKLNIIRPK
jgi:formate hydrogenlyase transcriptional activator